MWSHLLLLGIPVILGSSRWAVWLELIWTLRKSGLADRNPPNILKYTAHIILRALWILCDLMSLALPISFYGPNLNPNWLATITCVQLCYYTLYSRKYTQTHTIVHFIGTHSWICTHIQHPHTHTHNIIYILHVSWSGMTKNIIWFLMIMWYAAISVYQRVGQQYRLGHSTNCVLGHGISYCY